MSSNCRCHWPPAQTRDRCLHSVSCIFPPHLTPSITVFGWHDCKSVSVLKIPAWNGFPLTYHAETIAWSWMAFSSRWLILSAGIGSWTSSLHPVCGGFSQHCRRMQHVFMRMLMIINFTFIVNQKACSRRYSSVQQCVSVIEQWMAASWLRLNMDKTELMWTGTKYNVSKISICCHSLTLGGAQVVGSDAIRVLGVLLTPDLSLDKHVTAVSAKCFFQLRQLRRVWHSLDDDAAAALVRR